MVVGALPILLSAINKHTGAADDSVSQLMTLVLHHANSSPQQPPVDLSPYVALISKASAKAPLQAIMQCLLSLMRNADFAPFFSQPDDATVTALVTAGSNPATMLQVLECLCVMTDLAAGSLHVMAANPTVIQFILSALRPNTPAVTTAAISLVQKIGASSDEACHQLMSMGILPLLSSSLETPPTATPDMVVLAVCALDSICLLLQKEPAKLSTFLQSAQSRLVPHLLMKADNSDVESVARSITVMANIDNTMTLAALLNAHLAAAIVTMLRSTMSSTHKQLAALTLANVFVHQAEFAQRIVDADGISALLDLLKLKNTELTDAVMHVIQEIVWLPVARAALRNGSGHTSLVAQLPESQDALSVITQLIHHGDEVDLSSLMKANNSQLVPALFAFLSCNNPKSVEEASTTLTALASAGDLSTCLEGMQVPLQGLTDALFNPTPSIQLASTKCLAAMPLDKQVDKLVQMGTLQGLMQMVSSSDTALQRSALAVLEKLSRLYDGSKALIDAAAVPEIARLLQTPHAVLAAVMLRRLVSHAEFGVAAKLKDFQGDLEALVSGMMY